MQFTGEDIAKMVCKLAKKFESVIAFSEWWIAGMFDMWRQKGQENPNIAQKKERLGVAWRTFQKERIRVHHYCPHQRSIHHPSLQPSDAP